MDKEKLILYAKYVSKIDTVSYNDLKKLKSLIDQSKNDDELRNLLITIQQLNNFEQSKNLIDNYIRGKESVKKNEEQELISVVYGVDVQNIKHKILQDGCEVFLFYSNKLNKNIVLENVNKGKSLVEQLKEQQQENINFQTQDATYNADAMVEEQRKETNNELKMIPINEIGNYQNIISNLSPEKKDELDFLISNSDSLHIDTINIEHVFGLTSLQYDSNVIEAHYDLEDKRYKVEQSAEYNYGSETKENVEQNVKVNYDDNEENEIDTTIINDDDNYEIVAAKIEQDEELKGKIDLYMNYPELLNSLNSEDREYYERIISIYSNYNEQKQLKQEKQKVLTFKLQPNKINDKKAGYIDALILSLITGFVGGLITAIMFLMF